MQLMHELNDSKLQHLLRQQLQLLRVLQLLWRQRQQPEKKQKGRKPLLRRRARLPLLLPHGLMHFSYR